MKSENKKLTYKKIFTFWYPLAASWLMMGLEGPFVAAVIARLAEPKFNLAAHGVAFSFALIIEAPIIMLMSASTALCKDSDAFYKLRRFTTVLNASITGLMLILIIPAVFYFIGEGLIGLPRNVAQLTHTALILLLPWPAAIGVRRFYQGILIRYNLTRRVTYGTLVRLFTMAASALILYSFKVTGAYTGAAALSIGVTCEALAIRFMAHHAVKDLVQIQPADEDKKLPITYLFISKFYYPLALMSILALGVHPMVTFFMGKSRFPLESLAVLPVINVLVFLFRSFGLSYQEVVIALMREKKRDYIPLRNFAFFMGLAVTGGIALIAFTPLAEIWFRNISGLSLELASFAYFPTQLLVFLPALAVLISFQRSILVAVRKTAPISHATAIEVAMIIAVLYIGIIHFDAVGVIAAVLAYTIGRLCANLYLFPHQFRATRS
jgi:O-antigen/teichoic acid export membrane protein